MQRDMLHPTVSTPKKDIIDEHFNDEVQLVIRKLSSAAAMGSISLYLSNKASNVLDKGEDDRLKLASAWP